MQLLESFTGIGPNQIKLPLTFDPKGTWPGAGVCGYIAITNGTAAVITISDLTGFAFFNVPTYQSYTLVVPNYTAVLLKNATGAIIQPNDVLNVALYDSPSQISFTSFGPSAWGSGPQPGVLTLVNPGDQFFSWQIDQIIQYITGTGPASGPISTSGPTGGFFALDRDGVGGDFFYFFGSGGALAIGSAIGGTNVFMDESKNSIFQGRVEASSTGASGQPLLNWVPIIGPTGHSQSGTGNHSASLFDLSADVPASAVLVSFTGSVAWNSAAALTNVMTLASANPAANNSVLSRNPAAGATASDFAGILPIITAQNLLLSIVAGGADTWTVTVRPQAYAELS